ncbi:ATP-binding protein [Marinicellulosiphila megalodicopiae]|uniref:ATP-binding protein n=1 Tax=Marinicellulosiphila megalodicopiae TaxID=2724896 RepID=UPI003BAF1A7F
MTNLIQPLRFPYLSLMGIFLIILSSIYDHAFISIYIAPYILSRITQQLEYACLTLGLLICFWSFIRFQRLARLQKSNIQNLLIENNQIKKQNKSLNKKAFTYSTHADKLKYFISEKLLEFIEYDEKYLHFKSIASEVRHNGVISYDKVKTFIQTLQTQLKILNKNNPAVDISAIKQSSDDAMASMKYLWDLLDLATTDNIALHISDYLCECEEHYIQHSLNAQEVQSKDFYYQPKFALLSYLSTLTESSEQYRNILKSKKKTTTLINDQFYLIIHQCEELLGNPNHFILLIENIIKNAQFFLQKSKFKQKTDKIVIELGQENSHLFLNIYNRGPNIKDDNKSEIFKLGFSTRKVKENHGKGLGLFFSHEIVSGYEGKIRAENIKNPNQEYKLDITFDDESVEYIQIQHNANGETLTLNTKESHPHTSITNRNCKSEFNQTIKKIKICHSYSKKTHEIILKEINSINFVDNFSQMAQFCIDVQNKKRKSELKWTMLDISGVQFQIRLPLASARMDEFDETDMALDDEFESLDQKFNQDLE